jgi:hypothetical protein
MANLLAQTSRASVLGSSLSSVARALGFFLAATACFGQNSFQAPSAEVIAAGERYVPAKIGQAYANRLAEQPDFQGQWDSTTPDPERVGRFMFDPTSVSIPYEPPPGLPEFGPRAGTYLTGIPYKPEYQQQYMETVTNTAAGKSIDTFALCKPFGVPRMMAGAVQGFDIIQHPDVIIFHNAYSNETRRIFLDGRPHPSLVGPGGSDARTYSGHSVGRWEGDTLVVETTNLMAGFYDQTNPRYSDQVHLTERMRLISPIFLENRMTVVDPVMLTRPWEVTRYYRRLSSNPDGPPKFHNLDDRECKQSIDFSQGFQSVILPQEIEERERQAEQGAEGADSADERRE